MDPLEYTNFAFQYKNDNPNATAQQTYDAYMASKQGKQAMNTRLLGG